MLKSNGGRIFDRSGTFLHLTEVVDSHGKSTVVAVFVSTQS